MKTLQLQQAIRAGDDELVRLLDRELAPLISEVVDYRAASCREVHLQLRFVGSLIREDADDRSCVVRNSAILAVLLDRYFGGSAVTRYHDYREYRLKTSREAEGEFLNESILNALPDRVAVVTTDCRYLYANAAHAGSVNRSAFDLVGRHIAEFMEDDLFDSVVKEKLDLCFGGVDVAFDFLRRCDNSAILVRCHMSPLRADDGRLVGAVLTMRDVVASENVIAA